MATFWVEYDMLCAQNLAPGSTRDSIAKWAALRNLCLKGRLVHDGGTRTCALCLKYVAYGCDSCPVHEATGFFNCCGTPYKDYRDAIERRDIAMALSAAEEEIVFLQSLLEV